MTLALIPNLISLLRIALIYPVILALLHGRFEWALLLFCLAGLSDLADGYLARRFQWTSKLGGWLDAIADKVLLNAVYFVLWSLNLIPFWLLICVAGRDILIVSGVVFYYFKIEKVSAKPSIISRINTFMQLLLVVFILLQQILTEYPLYLLPTFVVESTMRIVLSLTLVSGVWYAYIGLRRAFFLKKGGI